MPIHRVDKPIRIAEGSEMIIIVAKVGQRVRREHSGVGK